MDNPAPARPRTQLLPLLLEEQEKSRYISEAFIEVTAREMGLSIAEVYGVVTFYHFLSVRPLGRHVIRVCKSITCSMKNHRLVVEAIQAELGIAPGQTTADGEFSLELVNCIGACDQAPAMLLNHELHGGLTAAKISAIIAACREK